MISRKEASILRRQIQATLPENIMALHPDFPVSPCPFHSEYRSFLTTKRLILVKIVREPQSERFVPARAVSFTEYKNRP